MPIFGLVSSKRKQEISGHTMYNLGKKTAGCWNRRNIELVASCFT